MTAAANLDTQDVTAAVLDTSAGDVTLNVRNGRIRFDEQWAPYIQADLTCAIPADAAAIEPRDYQRVQVTVIRIPRDGSGAVAQAWNLLVRERDVDHKAGTMAIRAESDEATLQDYKRISTITDVAAADYYTSDSLVGIVEKYVFGHLQPTWNLTRSPVACSTWQGHNFLTTTFRDDSNGWYMHNVRTSTGAVAVYLPANDPDEVVAGDVYRYTVDVYVTEAATLTPRAHYDGTTVSGSPVAVPANTWTTISVQFTPTAGAAYLSVLWSAGTVSRVLSVRRLRLTAGSAAAPAWDIPVLTDYAADFSFRDQPDICEWEPGLSAWDFLTPLLQAAGMRLFCDENREWHLVDASNYEVPGQVQLSYASRTTNATDRINMTDDAAGYADAVVIRYRWTDGSGAQQEAFDAAGVGRRVLRLDYDRKFPGAGAAARILERSRLRGRTLGLRAVSDYETRPGMAFVSDLPDTPLQTGYVASVDFQFPEFEMEVGTRGAVDTPAYAWVALPDGEAWTDSAPGETWIGE